jgi:carbon storage regulator
VLVLTRKQGQKIFIDTPQGPITVTFVQLDRGKIRLGIDAPPSMRVLREELQLGEKPKPASAR